MPSRLEQFPEYISGRIVDTADTFTQQQINIPSSLFGRNTGGSKVTVIELIEFWYSNTIFDILNAEAESYQINLTTNSRTVIGNTGESQTLFHTREFITINTAVGFNVGTTLRQITFGGQGGRGVLIASQNLFVGVLGQATGTAITTDWKIWYRLVEIDALRFSRLLVQQGN